MKQNKTSLYLIVFLFFTSQVKAQIQLSSDDIYSRGVYEMTIDTSHTSLIGTPGTNKVWDFTTLISHTPFTIKVAAFSDAKIDANLVEIEDGDTNAHIKKTSSSLDMLLEMDDIGTFQKLRLFNFPLDYNSTNKDSISSKVYFTGDDIGMPLIDSVRMDTKVVAISKTDAWGTLKIPMGTYNAMRIQSLFKYQITAYGKKGSLPYTKIPGFEEAMESEYYVWYSKNKGYYLANYDVEFQEMSFMVSGLDVGKSIKPKHSEILVTNPVSNEVILKNNGNSNYLATLFDMTGKQVFSEKIEGLSTNTIDASKLPPGIYNLQLYNIDTNSTSFQKIIK
ncbi:MAG: T9SS type A sorting domain-containing protein [Bacteroidia bacterium]